MSNTEPCSPIIVGNRVYMTQEHFARLHEIIDKSTGPELSYDTVAEICEFLEIELLELPVKLTVVVITEEELCQRNVFTRTL